MSGGSSPIPSTPMPINTRIVPDFIDADPEAVERATMAGLPVHAGCEP